MTTPEARARQNIDAQLTACGWVVDELLLVSLSNNLKRTARLRQAILKRAFEGKLVEQNPTDESASVFLERIKADKDKRPTQLVLNDL